MSQAFPERLPVQGLLRRALRAPLWLYRVHLGWLLGHQFLLLIHRGRKTGQPRPTVLEVVHYDKATGTHIVASGWGAGSDWYRNIQHTPQVIVQSGGARIAARAETLSADAAERELRWYVQHHPLRARELFRLMTGQPFDGTDAAIQRVAHNTPVVALRPQK
jgi:deazaflavin-dependent oxidoreductase (nitroreductase family)